MADQLSVDSAGLSSAASRSADIADALAATGSGLGARSQSSDVGVAAVDAAFTALRARASRKATQQAANLGTASAVYTHTDGDAAVNVARSV